MLLARVRAQSADEDLAMRRNEVLVSRDLRRLRALQLENLAVQLERWEGRVGVGDEVGRRGENGNGVIKSNYGNVCALSGIEKRALAVRY